MRSMSDGVPLPWAPGDAALAQRGAAFLGMTSPTLRWTLTECPVSTKTVFLSFTSSHESVKDAGYVDSLQMLNCMSLHTSARLK